MPLSIKTLILIVFWASRIEGLEFKYHKYRELESVLKNLSGNSTDVFVELNSIGRTFRGRELWVAKISANGNRGAAGIPNVKLIGNIHGNEAVGREILLHFLEFLKDSYGTNRDVTWVLDNTNVYILPSLNPDGFEMVKEGACDGDYGRHNARKVDLNRNFPAMFDENRTPKQLETQAVEDWMKKIPFVLSASLHGGALVANYPYDSVKEEKWQKLIRALSEVKDREKQRQLREDYIASLPKKPASVSPDDDVFVHLAHTYSNKHPEMHKGANCKGAPKFTDGITNGAAWYPFRGGMQDFNYVYHGCMELTLEISCCKYPNLSSLPHLWDQNRDALLEYIKQAHRGVRGRVVDKVTRTPLVGAVLQITGREMTFATSSNGEFWRILLPGNYSLAVNATGYFPAEIRFSVVDYGKNQPELTTLQIELTNNSYSTTSSTTELLSSTKNAEDKENLKQSNVETDGRKFFDNDQNLEIQTNYSKLIREQTQNNESNEVKISGRRGGKSTSRSTKVHQNSGVFVLAMLLIIFECLQEC